MANELTNYAENAVINYLLRTNPVYVGFVSAISDAEAGTVTELAGNNYSRKAATFSAPSNGVTANSSDIVFDTPSANWAAVVGIGLWDAAVNGNLLMVKSITSKTVNSGDDVKIPTGDLDFSIT